MQIQVKQTRITQAQHVQIQSRHNTSHGPLKRSQQTFHINCIQQCIAMTVEEQL